MQSLQNIQEYTKPMNSSWHLLLASAGPEEVERNAQVLQVELDVIASKSPLQNLRDSHCVLLYLSWGAKLEG